MDPAWLGLTGALLGVLLGAAGSLAGSVVMARRADAKQHQLAQLEAAREVLSSLQDLNRKLINIARQPVENMKQDNQLWNEQHGATTRWNTARYGAALICPPGEVKLLNELDRQVDLVFDAALSRQWTGIEFRPQRRQLGRDAAAYLKAVRANSGLSPIDIKSLWAWDDDAGEPTHSR